MSVIVQRPDLTSETTVEIDCSAKYMDRRRCSVVPGHHHNKVQSVQKKSKA